MYGVNPSMAVIMIKKLGKLGGIHLLKKKKKRNPELAKIFGVKLVEN